MRYFARRLFIFSRARASALLFLPFSPSSAHRITHSFRRFFKEKRKSVTASCCLLSCFLKNFCLLLLLSASNTAARGARERDKTKANKQKKEKRARRWWEVVVVHVSSLSSSVDLVGLLLRSSSPSFRRFLSLPLLLGRYVPPASVTKNISVFSLSLSLSLFLSLFLSFFLSLFSLFLVVGGA